MSVSFFTLLNLVVSKAVNFVTGKNPNIGNFLVLQILSTRACRPTTPRLVRVSGRVW